MNDPLPRIGDLVIAVPGADPALSIARIGEALLEPRYEPLLSLPLVEGRRVVGLISRYRMMQLLFRRFGRELFGRRPVRRFMKRDPVVIEADLALEDAAEMILERLTFPVTEDFVIVRDGLYEGMGTVLGLIQALQEQLAARSRQLAAALRNARESQSQLIHSEKMASLGQMVAGLAHEMNTPLGYVHGNVELAEQFFSESRRVNKAVFEFMDLVLGPRVEAEDFEAAVARLTRLREQCDLAGSADDVARLLADTRFGLGEIDKLIRGLKDFSRQDRAREEDIDLHRCLESALLLANNQLQGRIRVRREYGRLPAITGCPSQINQVLLNLLANAAQAMPGGGEIRLATGADQRHVHITISDTGTGIEEAVLPRIFDPFFTTNKTGEGTGLGLSISHRIIAQHGGRIDVVSRVGGGTTFTVRLPRSRRAIDEHRRSQP